MSSHQVLLVFFTTLLIFVQYSQTVSGLEPCRPVDSEQKTSHDSTPATARTPGNAFSKPKPVSRQQPTAQHRSPICAAAAMPLPACDSVVVVLNPCIGYIVRAETKPSAACCSGIDTLKIYNDDKAARRAICECLESVAPLLRQIDYSRFTGLPKKCGVSVKLPAVTSYNFDCSKA